MWLGIYRVNPHSTAEWMDTLYLLFIVYVYDYVHVFACLWLYANVSVHEWCVMYMNGMWRPWELFLKTMHLFCSLFICLRQALWLAWRLTKLSRLGSQQDPQTHLSPPPQHLDDKCIKQCPDVSQDGTQCLCLSTKTSPHPEIILNLNGSIKVLRELPCTPISQSSKDLSLTAPSSICITLGMACGSRYCVWSFNENLILWMSLSMIIAPKTIWSSFFYGFCIFSCCDLGFLIINLKEVFLCE